MPIKIKVKQTGRIKAPKLDNGPLTAIGQDMVARQKERWANHMNASGNQAKPLSKKYTFIKKKFLGVARPYRDNVMTGIMRDNFTLRKAIEGNIRAENTTRLARAHATGAVKFEDMIGFSGPEQMAIFRDFQVEYGQWVKRAWVQIR
jgi:hypothetical protein